MREWNSGGEKQYSVNLVHSVIIGSIVLAVSAMVMTNILASVQEYASWIFVLLPLSSVMIVARKLPKRMNKNTLIKATIIMLFTFAGNYAMLYPVMTLSVVLYAFDPMDTAHLYQLEFVPKYLLLGFGLLIMMSTLSIVAGRMILRDAKKVAYLLYDDNVSVGAISKNRQGKINWKELLKEIGQNYKASVKRNKNFYRTIFFGVFIALITISLLVPFVAVMEGYEWPIHAGITIG